MKGKSPKITKTEVHPKYRGFETAMEKLGNLASEFAGQLGQPYSGARVASMTPYQTKAMENLYSWFDKGGQSNILSNPAYSQSKKLLSDIIGGKYLSEESPTMRYYRQKILTEDLPKMQDILNREMSRRGKFYSSAAVQGDEDLLETAMDKLNELYANQWNTEFNRQLASIPALMQLLEYEKTVPLQDISTILQMEEFPRLLEQQRLSSDYEDWLRSRQEMMYPIQLAPTASQIFPYYEYSVSGGKASPFEKFISPALQIGAIAAAPFTGGASLAAIPATQAIQQGFATGANPGSFSNFVNAFAPLASLAYSSFAPRSFTGGVGGINTGTQMTPFGLAPTWSPYSGSRLQRFFWGY